MCGSLVSVVVVCNTDLRDFAKFPIVWIVKQHDSKQQFGYSITIHLKSIIRPFRFWKKDVSYSVADLGYPTIQNYFETSHTKGPQDRAGANLKSKADMTVIWRQQVIQNAHDLYSFVQRNMLTPVSGRSLSRRVFFYIEASNGNRPRKKIKKFSVLQKEISFKLDHCGVFVIS